MLGDSGEVLESSATAGEEEKDAKLEDSGERATGGGGGNRWPRPETLDLLRIRSEMDSAFRDSTLKAPLWEQISRKMAELGYRRSAKKCKEKFENVYKYHKRTKEGRFGKPEGKTYRFFDELEAFESLHSYSPEPKSQPPKLPTTTTTTMTTKASLVPWISSSNPSSGTNASPLVNDASNVNPSSRANPTFFTKQQSTTPFVVNHNAHTVQFGAGYKTNSNNFTSNVSPLNLFSSSTSSSTASEEEEEEEGKRLRKRRKHWKGLFKRLTKDMMEKQDEMQKRFLETLDKREKERIAREEAWRVQEAARANREYEILALERSAAAAKEAAIISFLQKVSGQQQHQQQQQKHKHRQQQPPFQGDHTLAFQSDQKHERMVEATSKILSNGDSNYSLSPSSSRWPKAEVEALIRLRTNVDANYQENGTKGSLWEEISGGMKRLGYNRSAKRCKEKWENINKYFKKVKESNKKRPIDSKTCPYFYQLDAIYKEKNKTAALPLMVAPQQQLLPSRGTRDDEFEKQKMGNGGDRVQDEEERESEEDEDDEDDGEEDNETGGFEMVLNKTCSPMDINNNVFA